jgi:hypothetical protein
MNDRIRIGSLIHRNRAYLARSEAALAEIFKLLSNADQGQRRRLRRMAWEVRRARWRGYFVGWLLRRLDPR